MGLRLDRGFVDLRLRFADDFLHVLFQILRKPLVALEPDSGDKRNDGAGQNKEDAHRHGERDRFFQNEEGEKRREDRLDVKYKRSCRGRCLFHRQKVEGIPKPGNENTGVQKAGQRAKADSADQRNAGKQAEAGGVQTVRNRADVPDPDQKEHFGTSEQKAQAGQCDPSVPPAARAANHIVQRKGQGRADGEQNADKVGGRQMQRVDDGEHSDHAEKNGKDGVPIHLFRQHQVSEQDGKNGIAAEQNRYHRSLRVQNPELKQNHAHDNADESRKSEEGEI